MARTLRLDLLGETRGMVVEPFPERWHTHDSLCHFSLTKLMERSDAPAGEVEKQVELWFMVGEITDNARSEREDSHPLSDDQVMRQREVDRGSRKLWPAIASRQRRRRQCTFKSSSKPAQADREGTTIIDCSGKYPS